MKFLFFNAIVIIIFVGFMFVVTPQANNKTRFELNIPVETRDDIKISVRIIGFYDNNIDVYDERGKLIDLLEERFGTIDYNEIPEELRLMFRDEISAAEERGIIIDSIYQYRLRGGR